MKIAVSWTLKSSPDEAYADCVDPRFQEEASERAGTVSHRCSVAEKAGGHEVTVQRVMSSNGAPEFVRKLIGATVEVTQVVTWGPRQPDGSRHGTLDTKFAGKPLSMHGTTAITPAGDGARVAIDADVKASVPVIGRKVEKVAAGHISSVIGVEETVSHEWDEARHS